MSEYVVEWTMDPHALEDDYNRVEMMEELAEEVEGDVEVQVPVRRLSADLPYVSIGTFAVTSAMMLIEVYRLLRERDGARTGIVKSSVGNYVYAGNYDETLIQEVGGHVIGRVEGDLIVEMTGEQTMEFNRIRDHSEEYEYDAVEKLVELIQKASDWDEARVRELVENAISDDEVE